MTALGLQRYLSSGVLVVWGVMLSYFYFSGRIGSYLHPAFHIATACCGVILILLALGRCLVVRDDDACCEENCGHVPKAIWQILGALVLVVPLVAATIISPSQFGAATVSNRAYVEDVTKLPGFAPPPVEPALPGETTTAPMQTEAYLPKNAAGQIQAQVIDLVYAAQEATMRSDFENKEVELIGQFMPARAKNPTGDRFDLVRMFMVCCAADSRPVAVTVQTKTPEKFSEMSWVKVVGKATFPVEGGRQTPVVIATEVQPCDPPEDSLIY